MRHSAQPQQIISHGHTTGYANYPKWCSMVPLCQQRLSWLMLAATIQTRISSTQLWDSRTSILCCPGPLLLRAQSRHKGVLSLNAEKRDQAVKIFPKHAHLFLLSPSRLNRCQRLLVSVIRHSNIP